MNGDCEYKHDGYDTDGTEWFRCTTHDELAPSKDAPCEGYIEIPYLDAEQRRARPDEWPALLAAREGRPMLGITWANKDETLFQTGYIYPTIESAREAARRGIEGGSAAVSSDGTRVDPLAIGGLDKPAPFAQIETEDDMVEEWSADGRIYPDGKDVAP